MIFKRSYLYIFLAAAICLSGCLSIRLRTANENYQQFAYAEAIKDYEWVLQKKKISEAIPLLADCYRETGNSVKAEYWYGRAVKLPNAEAKWKYYLGEALMRNGKYEEARQAFSEYLLLNRNDLKVQRLMASCDSLQLFYRDTSLYTIQLLRFNVQGENNFSPTFYRSGIVFLSDRNYKGLTSSKSDWTGKKYLDLFYASKTEKGNWIEPEPLRGDVNGRFNEGPAVFTSDFNTMYFTRNNYVSNKVEKNKRNVNVLKIYKAEHYEGEWKLRGPMFFNSEEYSMCHPALSSDGTVVYFASDIPWGYGGMDIYMVRWEGGSNWSKPINLGAKVNSEGNEVFPFLKNDSILYYSSDGLHTMGGLDIFCTHYEYGEWQAGENLNSPVNSSLDDFGFIIDSAGMEGYFSSNRFAGLDKLFSFKRNQPNLRAVVDVIANDQAPVISNTEITVYCDGLKDTVITVDGMGKLTFKLAYNHKYDFEIDNRDFFSKTVSITTAGRNLSETIPVDILLERIHLNKPVVWPGIDFQKKDWQLKLNAGDALEKLVTLLENNPRIHVELGAYTDTRGGDAENQKLTQKRAELVMQYLVSRGIKANRLTPKGYGETKLLNKCVNGVLCIEEDHQENNRIEVSIKNISQTASR